MTLEEKLSRFIASRFDLEAASDYAQLRKCPSGYTRKCIDYVSALNVERRETLRSALVSNALFLLLPDRDPQSHAYQAGHTEYRSYIDELVRMWHWDYTDVRTLRLILADLRSPQPSGYCSNTPEHVVRRAEAIRPTKATEIRKTVKEQLGRAFGARPTRLGGGLWRYEGAHRGRSFAVEIDYASGHNQIRYAVFYDDESTGVRAARLTMEGLLGMGLGAWDQVTVDNLPESVQLLCGWIRELVEIPEAA